MHRELLAVIKVEKQKIYDEVYEDLNNLISVTYPIESQDDPVWRKGARFTIVVVCLAMLEDNEYPGLEVTREESCFYNVNKAISNSEDEFRTLKEYFMGCPELSKSVGLSRQALLAADTTLASYMFIAFDKLSTFSDEGLCSLTSKTDIDPQQSVAEPTALFPKTSGEEDTRHVLAAVFVLCIYETLTKVASAREGLGPPGNTYFILDELGNMPEIDKLDKMITVDRSRKTRFSAAVQSYVQLDSAHGQTISNTVKSSCGLKMFIGSNDMEACEEFSKLCGSKTAPAQGVSSTLGDKTGNTNVPNQVQTRPLIYPPELQRLNNKSSAGNAVIVTLGNYPLKTQPALSHKCPLYGMKVMDLSQARVNASFGDEIYYDLDERNYIIASRREKEMGVSAE